MMKPLGNLLVLPSVPERIALLRDLATNLWWSWHPEAQQLFESLDPTLWHETHHNPVQLLREIEQSRLERAAADPTYLRQYEEVISAFQRYLKAEDTWLATTYPHLADRTVAYFSAEFGLHECIPIYSGGLGVLAGDHCKSASDLGLPFVGVGFFYQQGYFRQRIGPSGTQEAHYEPLNPDTIPIQPAVDANGLPATFTVDLPGRQVTGRVWHVQVGRTALYLLDTDTPNNRPEDRTISGRLYGGDREMRLTQEIVLGIGGVRALRALGISPCIWHLNEGHAAFVLLERARELVEQGLSFAEAREVVAASSVFTTHTPVPAGNDAFDFDLIDRYFHRYWPLLGLDRDAFIDLARQELPWGQMFSMTALALRLSDGRNGVSELHGSVSRRIWSFLWPEVPVEEVPIGSVTNGVHTASWLAPEMGVLYDHYLPVGWRDAVDDPTTWEAVDQIPDDELFTARQEVKHRMVRSIRRRIREERRRRGELHSRIDAAETLLDPQALTIGFARRFATYKRATLLFRDPERLKRILSHSACPVQIVFAGKAHPADEPGKALIQRIYQLMHEPEFEGRILFIEDYDMDLARQLVQGCDVWLNTPLRPLEASGTSGQKAALNGVPSASVLDGWWHEGYDGTNGWSIGDERDYESAEARDIADSQALYDLIENTLIPLYTNRTEHGYPTAWMQVVRAAIRTVAPRFNTHRMVKDYVRRYYLPACARGTSLSDDQFARARQLVTWKHNIANRWANIRIGARIDRTPITSVGKPIHVEAEVYLDRIEPQHVVVEVVHAKARNGTYELLGATPLDYVGTDGNGKHRFAGSFIPSTSGNITYGVRVLPSHPSLPNSVELGLVRWADPAEGHGE